MTLKFTLPIIAILVVLLALGGWLLREEIKRSGELANALETAKTTNRTVRAERNALDRALADRDQTVATLRATADSRLQQLQKVKADACLDASVPVAIDSLLNAGAGGAGH